MALTFKTAFKNEMSKALEPLGFQKVKKSNHPFLARVINGEIVEAVTCFSGYKPPKGWGVYFVEIGIASIYTDTMDMSVKNGNNGWFRSMGEYYGATLKPNGFEQLRPLDSVPCIEFQKGDEQAMLDSIRECANYAAGVFSETDIKTVTDIDSYFDWLVRHHMARLLINYEDDFASSVHGHYAGNEGLLWLLTSEGRDPEAEFARHIERENLMYKARGEEREALDHGEKQNRLELVHSHFRMMNEPELKEAAMREIERRKEMNLLRLRTQGFGV
ncbi:MAG: hypothetical protein K6B74_07445 [Ruminococcus sp.]|nr:hypothetical protein [Ruminococcus sp.]